MMAISHQSVNVVIIVDHYWWVYRSSNDFKMWGLLCGSFELLATVVSQCMWLKAIYTCMFECVVYLCICIFLSVCV